MVDPGNLVVMRKQGGMAKHLSKDAQEKTMGTFWAEKGPEVLVTGKGSTFLMEVDVESEGDASFTAPRKTMKGRKPMYVDHEWGCALCGFGKKTWESFLEYDGPAFKRHL